MFSSIYWFGGFAFDHMKYNLTPLFVCILQKPKTFVSEPSGEDNRVSHNLIKLVVNVAQTEFYKETKRQTGLSTSGS